MAFLLIKNVNVLFLKQWSVAAWRGVRITHLPKIINEGNRNVIERIVIY